MATANQRRLAENFRKTFKIKVERKQSQPQKPSRQA
jgi:hypothetical protein